MKRKVFNKKGFTMIELITAMVIISIVSVMAGMGLVQIGNAYLLAKKSTVSAQQAQITLTRLAKELVAIKTISAATPTSLTYSRSGVSHTLAWGGTADQPLTLDGDTLIDKVQSFSLTYHNTYAAAASSYSPATAVIELTFQLKGYSDIPLIFVKRV
ncbi:MAG: prepilin-type N-terminal cleavage/methylation domain-containing protein, partial [Desulfobacterales bacterium]|nr:prepilin-type N-terminal cleavage/methylation domain-containing protein [Desulfobacterales bacterium]